MASVFIKHRCSDFARWKVVFDEHQPARAAATVTGHSLHRDATDPNVTILALRVKDLKKAQEFAASDDLKEAMKNAGVEGPPEIWFAEDVEEKTY